MTAESGGLIAKLRGFFAADPPLHAVAGLVRSVWLRCRSKVYAWLFHAPGLYLGPGCLIRGTRYIQFGNNCYVYGQLWMEAVSNYRGQRFKPAITIGDNVSFSQGVHLSCIDRLCIGHNVLFGSRVYVSDHNHGCYQGAVQSHPEEPPAVRPLGGGGPVEIGDCVWIGENAVLVGPVTIGSGAIIAANAVVRSNVAPRTMVGGVPAKVLRYFNEATGQWERPSASPISDGSPGRPI